MLVDGIYPQHLANCLAVLALMFGFRKVRSEQHTLASK